MAILTGGGDRIESNNKINLESGTYNVTIVDEWVHFVTKELDGEWPDGSQRYRSKYSKEATGDQEIKITVTLDDDPTIALSATMSAYISKNSKLAKMASSLTGKTVAELRDGFDTKSLRGMKAVADLFSKENESAPWTNVKEIRARPKSLARPIVRPTPQPQSAKPPVRDEYDEMIDEEIPF